MVVDRERGEEATIEILSNRLCRVLFHQRPLFAPFALSERRWLGGDRVVFEVVVRDGGRSAQQSSPSAQVRRVLERRLGEMALDGAEEAVARLEGRRGSRHLATWGRLSG